MGVSAISDGAEMKLEVKYRGSDVDRGRMNALELGPAIFGMGEMVGAASRILYSDDTRVRVEVQADFPHASFGIEFYAVAAAQGLLPNLTLTQLSEIVAVLGFTGTAVGGVIKLLRWQNKRPIERVEQHGDNVRMMIGGDARNVTINEYDIFINPQVRDGVRSLVRPLEQDGVDSVAITAGNAPPEIITREDRDVFAGAPLPEEPVAVDRSTATLEIISLSFRETNKWRFSQGSGTFYATILDEAFLVKVASERELFGAGDALRVELEIRTTRVGTDLRFEYTVLRVIEHMRADRGPQLELGAGA